MGNWLEALQGLQEGSSLAGQQIGQGTLAREKRDAAQKKAAEDEDYRMLLERANAAVIGAVEANQYQPLSPQQGLEILGQTGLDPDDWDAFFESGMIQRPAKGGGKPGKPEAIANAIPGHPGYYYDPETGQARKIEGLPAKDQKTPAGEKRLEDMSVEELTKLLRDFEPRAYQDERGRWVVEEGDPRNPLRRQKIQELIQKKMGMVPGGFGVAGPSSPAPGTGGAGDDSTKKNYSSLWE